MKKLSLLTVLAVLVTAGIFLTGTNIKAQSNRIEGWALAGTNPKSYEIGLDPDVYKSQAGSAYLMSKGIVTEGFGTLMQSCSAQKYLGKRIKMTGYIKPENVTGWAGMWMRVDSKEKGTSLSFDNMQNRPIKGTGDWVKCEIVLDVPANSGTLNYGVLLSGTGKVWFDQISFDVVDNSVNITTPYRSRMMVEPTNLNFSK